MVDVGAFVTNRTRLKSVLGWNTLQTIPHPGRCWAVPMESFQSKQDQQSFD